MGNAFQKEGPSVVQDKAEAPKKSQQELWLDWVNNSVAVRIAFFAITAVVLQVLTVMSPFWQADAVDSMRAAASVLAITVALGVIYWQALGDHCEKNKTFVVTIGAVLVHLSLIVFLHGHASFFTDSFILERLALPYILAPLLVTVLLGVRLGTFSVLAVTLLGAFYVQPEQQAQGQYIVFSILTGMLTVYLTRNVRSRKQLLKAGLVIGVLVLLLSCLFGLIRFNDASVGTSDKVVACMVAFSVSLVISIMVSGLFPVIEGAFRIITPISWLELTDMNHKLLKRLQLEAPGTFHHCLVVAQLAEAAAEAIGSNGSYCRVISLYHDIGKVKHPQYFIENLMDGESNPHDELTPTMSARIIIGHVSDGVELAKENNLNRLIVDAIQQHHGTSFAYFFYRKALEHRKEMEEKVELDLAKVDDIPEVNEQNFRYNGPNPGNKEIGIMSLADIVESATRSLQRPTVDELTEMVTNLMKARIVDGHLDDSGLTLGDLHLVRDSFINTLKNMRHARIAYPKDDKPKEPDARKEENDQKKETDESDKLDIENKSLDEEVETEGVS